MKSFIAVFAVVLLAFGASILYYRGDFNVPQESKPAKISQVNQETKTNPPTNPSTVSQKTEIAQNPAEGAVLPTNVPSLIITSLEIRQKPTGRVKVGASVILTAVGKEKNGVQQNVNTAWSMDDPTLGDINSRVGTETKFTAKKVGKAALTATYQGTLTATKTIEVVEASPVLGTTTVQPAKPAVTAVEIRLFDTNGSRLNNGETRNYSAQVFYSDNSLKSVDVNWSVDPADLGSLNRTKGPSVDFKASRSGSGYLKAALGNISASLYIQVN